MPIQLTAGQAGHTVLMPLHHQPGSVLQQAAMPQVINTSTLNKTIQPRPTTVISMPTHMQQTAMNPKIKNLSGVTTLSSNSVTSLPLTIPVASLGMVSTAQIAGTINQGPRMTGPAGPTQQVLNIPRLHLGRPGGQLQAIRTGDPRHTLVLQQPTLRPPLEKSPTSTLTQIRPREIQPLCSPDAKIVAIQPQGHVQMLHAPHKLGGTVLLAQPTSPNAAAPQGTTSGLQLRVPTCITSPVRIAKSTEDVPLNLDTKTSSPCGPPGLTAVPSASVLVLTPPALTSSTQQAANSPSAKSSPQKNQGLSSEPSESTATSTTTGKIHLYLESYVTVYISSCIFVDIYYE